jgi:ADP-heptose:LPS heptosyltransferase
MLEHIRAAVGLQAARFHFRKWVDEIMPFAETVSDARTILLILPLDGGPLFPVAPVITMLRAHKREADITVVLSSQTTEALDPLQRCPVIRILPDEITTFFLPRRALITRINKRHHDLAIDLNLDFHVPSGYICRESRAPVRIGFTSKRSDTFYNFQVQTAAKESRMVRYERLAKCLQMF